MDEFCGETVWSLQQGAGGLATQYNTHPGIVRMKHMARCYLWWLGLNDDIEVKFNSCEVCQLHRAAPAAAPLHP